MSRKANGVGVIGAYRRNGSRGLICFVGEDWDASAQAWIDFVEQNASRTHLLDPVMLDLAGDVRGRRVCDVGCGEGRFGRMLRQKGASVVGIDPTLALIRHASEQSGECRYIRASGESIPIDAGRVDLVVSYLTLIDIPDFRAAIGEMARILKPAGRLLIANLNSFMTTSPRAWTKDEDGNSQFVAVDNYFEERPVQVSWCGIEVANWHRPQTAYLTALLDSGLVLRTYLEPRPSLRAIEERPDLADADRVPFFHVMLWEKPA